MENFFSNPENAIGARIKKLRMHYKLGINDFAAKCGLSYVAIFYLETGKTAKPHKGSLVAMVEKFNTTIDWLLFGTGEMLPNGETADLGRTQNGLEQWYNETLEDLKSRNEDLQAEIDRLWRLVNYFTGEKPQATLPLKEIIRNIK